MWMGGSSLGMLLLALGVQGLMTGCEYRRMTVVPRIDSSPCIIKRDEACISLHIFSMPGQPAVADCSLLAADGKTEVDSSPVPHFEPPNWDFLGVPPGRYLICIHAVCDEADPAGRVARRREWRIPITVVAKKHHDLTVTLNCEMGPALM